MSIQKAGLPDRDAKPIEDAKERTGEIQQDLKLASDELHLTNTALERHLPSHAVHPDVERALAQNVAVEEKVQEAVNDLGTVAVLLEEETAERERLERELATATGRPAH